MSLLGGQAFLSGLFISKKPTGSRFSQVPKHLMCILSVICMDFFHVLLDEVMTLDTVSCSRFVLIALLLSVTLLYIKVKSYRIQLVNTAFMLEVNQTSRELRFNTFFTHFVSKTFLLFFFQ